MGLVCRDCKVKIEHVTIKVDLIQFELDELDACDFENEFSYQVPCDIG